MPQITANKKDSIATKIVMYGSGYVRIPLPKNKQLTGDKNKKIFKPKPKE